MIELIGEFIKSIIFLLVLSALVHIISPDNTFKKFINFVMGLMLISALINPISVVTSRLGVGGNNYTDSFLWTQLTAKGASLSKEKDYYESKQVELVLSAHKNELEEKTRNILLSRFGLNEDEFSDLEINVCEDKNEKNFGSITDLSLTLLKEDEEEIMFKNIMLGNADSSLNQNENIADSLKNYFSDFYNLSDDNIYITVQKKKE